MDAGTSSPVVSGGSSRFTACRFCGLAGAVTPIGTLFPGRGILTWPPWSIARIRREDRPDIELPDQNVSAEEARV